MPSYVLFIVKGDSQRLPDTHSDVVLQFPRHVEYEIVWYIKFHF